jgi:hypothetical protein
MLRQPASNSAGFEGKGLNSMQAPVWSRARAQLFRGVRLTFLRLLLLLLLLLLQGDQSREVVRVLVECCLQESRYNPYYGHLAARLAAVSKSHKVRTCYMCYVCCYMQSMADERTNMYNSSRLFCKISALYRRMAYCVQPAHRSFG